MTVPKHWFYEKKHIKIMKWTVQTVAYSVVILLRPGGKKMLCLPPTKHLSYEVKIGAKAEHLLTDIFADVRNSEYLMLQART